MGAPTTGLSCSGKIKPRMPRLQRTPADRIYCDIDPVKVTFAQVPMFGYASGLASFLSIRSSAPAIGENPSVSEPSTAFHVYSIYYGVTSEGSF